MARHEYPQRCSTHGTVVDDGCPAHHCPGHDDIPARVECGDWCPDYEETP